VADTKLDEAAQRSDDRRRSAETRATDARRRAVIAREEAEAARTKGNARAAAVHDHEAAIHQRAVDIHLQAVRLQEAHSRELEEVFGRKGIDAEGLRLIMANVRRARDEAELRSEQARTYATRARERAQQLHARDHRRDPDG
jgi:hypothetical protein